MKIFNMTEEEKKKILLKHKEAIKKDTDKKTETKKGLQTPKKN